MQEARHRVVRRHPREQMLAMLCPDLLTDPGHHRRFGEQFLCTLLLTSSSCLPIFLPLCFCLSFLVCGLLLVIEACLAFVWGRLEVLGSRHSLEQPSFLIPWWDNSELWSSGPLLSPRRMEPQLRTMITHSLMTLCWLSFLPCLNSLLPDYTSRNIFPNKVLAPKSLSLDTRTSTGVQTHMTWILFWESIIIGGNGFVEL